MQLVGGELYSLRAKSPKRSGSRAGKGRKACNYVSGIASIASLPLEGGKRRDRKRPRMSENQATPSTELSDLRQSARSGNKHECKQTLKNTYQG